MTEISSHAEYRHTDYHFERTQSRSMAQLQWEDRRRVFRLWRNDIACAVGIVLLGILAFPVADIVVDLMAGRW